MEESKSGFRRFHRLRPGDILVVTGIKQDLFEIKVFLRAHCRTPWPFLRARHTNLYAGPASLDDLRR